MEDRIMDVESEIREGKPHFLARLAFLAKPALYISILFGAVLLASAFKLRTEAIFACQADGYTPDWYLAYCGADGYGDYEHGAFWFGLEPSALTALENADVVFLGDSKTNFGFSTDATARWFSAKSARYYLLGFTYGENVSFTGKVLGKVNSQARIYVIAVEFLERAETIPGKDVMRSQDAHYRYTLKRLWQLTHRPFCGAFPRICLDKIAIYRSRQTGSYTMNLSRWVGGAANAPVSYDHEIDREKIKQYVASGREFLSHVPVSSECIVLTTIPTIRKRAFAYSPSFETAAVVAATLGLSFIAPHLDELKTYDGSHLDRPSAERWSEAFFQAAGPQMQKCLSKPRS